MNVYLYKVNIDVMFSYGSMLMKRITHKQASVPLMQFLPVQNASALFSVQNRTE
jgi:hypothetical protein